MSHAKELSRKYLSNNLESSILHHLAWVYCIDLLRNSLAYSNPDLNLFQFVCQSLIALDKSKNPNLFPLAFSFALLKQFGIAPNLEEFINHENYEEELLLFFSQPLNKLPDELQIPQLIKNQIFNQILNHYLINLPNFQKPNSLKLIHSILN